MAHTKHTVALGNETVEYWRIDNDTNGNPRYVVHYLAIPFRDWNDGELFWDYQSAHIRHAANALGGTKYRAKWFGGGIVFQSFNVKHDISKALAN